MFDKILKELKTRYKDLRLGDAVLKAKANQLAKAVSEETEIEVAVIGAEDDLKIFQSIADAGRQRISELEKKLAETPEAKAAAEAEAKKEDPKIDPPAEDMPVWAKQLMESNKILSESLGAMKAKEVNLTNAQKLDAKLKELGVSEQFSKFHVSNKTFTSDEEIEEFAAGLKEAETSYRQAINDDKANKIANPTFGVKAKEGEVSADVNHFIETTFKPKA